MKQASRQALSTANRSLSTAHNSLQKGWEQAQRTMTSSIKADATESDPRQAGAAVQTPYGTGMVQEFRANTSTFVVRLESGGLLYTQEVPTIVPSDDDQTTASLSSSLFTPFASINSSNNKKTTKAKTVLELNETFLQWEKTRHQHVAQECERLGIPFTEQTKHQCFACLKQDAQQHQQPNTNNEKRPSTALLADAQGKPLFPRLYKLRQSGRELVAENTQHVKKAVAAKEAPCLLCAAVCCGKHSSAAFRKENVTLCLECVSQVESNAYQTVSSPLELEQETQRLLDLYQRACILLQYCAPYMLTTAEQLEAQTKQHNEIAGVGGSSVGLASGILGVAAACTILTPMGPPLLLGSLVMGGSATAVQAGGEAYKYYSEPNQLANRIMTLKSIVNMLLEKFQAMREKTLIPYLEAAASKLEVLEELPTKSMSSAADKKAKQTATLSAGACIGSTAATSAAASLAASEGAMAGRMASRVATGAARTARVFRFAGGALSAATLVLEARELRRTLDQIEKGNPCEKAEALREIHVNLEKFPSQNNVSRTCKMFVKVRSREIFREAMTGSTIIVPESAPSATTESSKPTQSEDDWQLVEEVVTNLENSTVYQYDENSVISGVSFCNTEVDQRSNDSFEISPEKKASLLRRLVLFKQREARKEQDVAVDLVV